MKDDWFIRRQRLREYSCSNCFIFFRYRVESRIADAICKNNSLVKVGLKFQFTECFDRVQQHLMSNIDRARKDRVKSGALVSTKTSWNPTADIEIRCVGAHLTDLVSLQKRCIGEHISHWTPQADTYRRGALLNTSTVIGPIQTDTEKT